MREVAQAHRASPTRRADDEQEQGVAAHIRMVGVHGRGRRARHRRVQGRSELDPRPRFAASQSTLPWRAAGLLLSLCVSPHAPRGRRARRRARAAPGQAGFLETAGVGVGLVGAGGAAWWFTTARPTARRARARAAAEADAAARAAARRARVRRAARAAVERRGLRRYDGAADPDGPLLIAVDGKVYNCWKGRHFYLPGAEYAIFAGRDATRLLARSLLEEEPDEQAARPITTAEKAALTRTIWTLPGGWSGVRPRRRSKALIGFAPSAMVPFCWPPPASAGPPCRRHKNARKWTAAATAQPAGAGPGPGSRAEPRGLASRPRPSTPSPRSRVLSLDGAALAWLW